MKLLLTFYNFECRLFQEVNRHYDNRLLNPFFSTITHLGGASFSILAVILMIAFSAGDLRIAAVSSAAALVLSHVPVHFVKKFFPRKRPYITLGSARFPSNPLKDHSFPSGHTTAIFSVITPFLFILPQLSITLLIVGISVGLSRIYLGLHYPSDVLVGGLLGTFTGLFCLNLMMII